MIWYSHLFKDFPQFVMIHIVKSFGIVNKAEVDDFLELSCFFYDLRSWHFDLYSSAFLKYSLNIWKFSVHVLLKPGLKNFEHYFDSMWGKCNCVVVWAFFALPFFGNGMKTELFQSCGHCELSKFAGILSAALSWHHLLGFEIAPLEFNYLH